MKKMRSIVKLLFLVFLLIPVNVFALNNNVDVSIDLGSGDFKFAGGTESIDTDSVEVGLMYTHYVTPLETDNSPYGVRNFLQHPSSFSAGYSKYDWEAEDSVGDTIEIDGNMVGFGGIFYTPSENNATGFGLTYISTDIDLDVVVGGVLVGTSESEYKTPILTVQQYVSPNTRIGLSYSMEDAETNDVSHDENVLTLQVESFLDKAWLSAYFKNGKDDWPAGYSDDDISGFGFTVGGYPSQKLGLFFNYNTKEIDDGTSETDISNLSFTGDFYLNEKTHFKATINRHKEDDPTFADIEETIVTIGAGFYF